MILSHFLVCLYVRHYGKIYDGQHEAILDQNLWDQVQNKLSENAARPRSRTCHIARTSQAFG